MTEGRIHTSLRVRPYLVAFERTVAGFPAVTIFQVNARTAAGAVWAARRRLGFFEALEVTRTRVREAGPDELALLIGPERSEGPSLAPRREATNPVNAVTPERNPANGDFFSPERSAGPNGDARLDEGEGR